MLHPAKSFSIICLTITTIFSCKNEPKNQVAAIVTKPDTIQVKPVSSVGAGKYLVTEGIVTWTGKRSLGDAHQGTITVEKGELMVNENQVLSGRITLDMNSIAVTDIKDAGERRDLESHLKDADFFEADKFPKAEFTIREVLPSNTPAFNWLIVGDLTMKGKTNSVNIPVKMTVEGDKLKAESPTFTIQRTKWGVNFRSGMLGTTKDKMIDDNVLLTLTLLAKKG